MRRLSTACARSLVALRRRDIWRPGDTRQGRKVATKARERQPATGEQGGIVQRQRRRGALVVAAWRPRSARRSRSWRVGDGGGELAVDRARRRRARADGGAPRRAALQPDRRLHRRRAPGSHQLIWTPRRQADRVPHDRGRRAAGGRRRRRRRWGLTSGRRRTRGIGATRTSTPPGSRRCSTRPSTSRWTSGRCTRRCAIRRATSSTATSACARTMRRTRRRSRRRPTAPTCRISCARTSRGSSGCRSASATAIAATNRAPPRCTTFYSNDDAPQRARTRWRR